MTPTDKSGGGTVESDEAIIEIAGMHKWYGEFHVLKDINLRVCKGAHCGVGRPVRENPQ